MAEAVIDFKLEGISPLLCHNPASMLAPAKPPSKGVTVYDAKEEAELSCYRNESGALCFPTIGVRNAALSASSAFKMGKGRATVKTYLAHIAPMPDLAVILNAKDRKAFKTYQIDVRRAVVGKASIPRVRARFDDWALDVGFLYDTELMGDDPRELMTRVLNDAGSRFGIGDYRPDTTNGKKGGWFGRFRVVE
jgi:hypothetical protein